MTVKEAEGSLQGLRLWKVTWMWPYYPSFVQTWVTGPSTVASALRWIWFCVFLQEFILWKKGTPELKCSVLWEHSLGQWSYNWGVLPRRESKTKGHWTRSTPCVLCALFFSLARISRFQSFLAAINCLFDSCSVTLILIL